MVKQMRVMEGTKIEEERHGGDVSMYPGKLQICRTTHWPLPSFEYHTSTKRKRVNFRAIEFVIKEQYRNKLGRFLTCH